MGWEIAESETFKNKLKRYQKKHLEAAAQAINNSITYLDALKEGIHPMQINSGFIHSEPQGSIAVDESGSGKKLHATRLYLYPDTETKTLWYITIGDKKTQNRSDIKYVNQFMSDLKKEKKR